MQKIVYIHDRYLEEVNELLQEGWEVVSLHPISTHTERTCDMGAYVVLKPIQTSFTYCSRTPQKIDVTISQKSGYSYTDGY